jgi:pectate lyase
MNWLSTILRSTLLIAAIALAGHSPLTILATWLGPSPAEAMHAPVEGFGAATTGGAGKPDCVVTSLSDSGAGTLRQCLSGGNKNIRFATSGTITLSSALSVPSFVTIDGFSAPSPGITLRNAGLNIRDAQHIIVRGLRIRDAGLAGDGTDCVLVFGASHHIVFDHLSISNCGDGGIDISAGPKDITIQWTLISTTIPSLWGSTDDLARDTDRITMHHSAFICGGRPVCDRFPLIRANGFPVRVDFRHNILEGWTRSNGTKPEASAQVNVVGNAYIPRPESSLDQRQSSVQAPSGTRVYTAGNVDLGATPRPDLNNNGNESQPLPAPAVSPSELGCVVRNAGMSPRDSEDARILTFVSAVPVGCSLVGSTTPTTPTPPPSEPTPPPASSPPVVAQPDLVPRVLSAPNAGTAGQKVAVTTTIANAGTASSPGSTARLFIAGDRTRGTNDLALDSISVPGLSPGATHTSTTNPTLPASTTPGNYLLLVRADDDGAVTEANKTNNTMTMPITIAAAATPPPATSFKPVLINAESMTLTTGMKAGSDSGALGGGYISATGKNSINPVREASASVTVPAGTYYLWARLYGPSFSEDALYLGIDSSWTRVFPSAAKTYEWVRVRKGSNLGFQLEQGTHTIQVGHGEVNARLDAVYLTNSSSDVPNAAPTP